jgi:hypothetical protein
VHDLQRKRTLSTSLYEVSITPMSTPGKDRVEKGKKRKEEKKKLHTNIVHVYICKYPQQTIS